jgi:WD40 repeat protein
VALGELGDREVIVSGSEDGAVRIWDLSRTTFITVDLLADVSAVAVDDGVLCVATGPALCTFATGI